MILLDTNVISEVWKPAPNPAVLAWLNAQPENVLYLCTPVLAELRHGLERISPGRRRDRLRSQIDRLETDLYRDRVLVLDSAAAAEFGRLTVRREQIGRRMETMDALIAAIALAHGAALATRDSDHFASVGLQIVNPFRTTAPDHNA